ncbi:e3 ubiquitin-protein ligase DTX1 [Nephila pilipes]|uniref:E3 ubiquitin-protein ligase n=1 Tax=Nephila pilipes TaxID=299642 RepID=A0A8X6Q3B6_NEPPI|nr:e3 ubiquitin-protein ligase DTX1 [Nephila pilipes]
MADNKSMWKFVVWERMNKTGKWCPYSAEVCQLIEQSYKKELEETSLGDADENLKIYSVNFKDMVQVSSVTGTKSTIRRRLCDNMNMFCSGFTWQWNGDHDSWYSYEVDVNDFIEKAYNEGLKNVTLKKVFRGYNYEIDFAKMVQINKQTKRKRPIRRNQNLSPFPVANTTDICGKNEDNTIDSATNTLKDINYSDLSNEIPGTTALFDQVNRYMRNVKRTYNMDDANDNSVLKETGGSEDMKNSNDTVICEATQNVFDNQPISSGFSTTAALVNGRPWYDRKPPHTPQSKLKPVPGIEPLAVNGRKIKKKRKVRLENISEADFGIEDILNEYTVVMEANSSNDVKDEDCIICCEPLSGGSSYDDDTSVSKLKECPHAFHKSCLIAMYNSGPKDKCLQCPICKKIYGVKYGIQPSGNMIYHVLPYSLPGYPECDTIRIIYDIPSGTQGPEHPMPGRKYTVRGFPRHCYLPDNEMGRKVLRLLVKAWKRRLIFTIGRSSTTGEENTVTWNEIHHKTEFGYNRRGHGFPDPNYFSNVLSELEAHGIKDDEVYLWYPAEEL